MAIDTIRLFISTARHLSITKAAQEFRISQSTASRQLTQFQADLGTTLLKRNGRGIELTKSGRAYLLEVEPIYSLLEQLQKKYNRNRQSLTLAGSHGPCTHLLPSLVEEFTQKHPSTRVNSRIGSTTEIEDLILASDVDLAVISNRSMSSSLQMEPFRNEKLVAFVSPTNPLARKKSISTSEFEDIKLIVKVRRNGQSRTETQLSEFTKKGIKFKTVLCFESSQSLKKAVRHGAGVGILFHDTIKPDIDQGEFAAVRLAGLDVTRQTYIAYSKERPLSPIAREFLSLLRASATNDAAVDALKTPIASERRKTRLPDYVLRSALLSWITSAASLDWIPPALV